MRKETTRNRLCNVQYSPGEYCRHRRMTGSKFCHVHQDVSTRIFASDEEVQAEFLKRAEELSYLAHYRVVCQLLKAGAKIITIGSRGYPDILFEMKNRVFGIEVKDKYDRLGNRQRVVLDALRRLERVEVIRESGEKRRGELSLKELLNSIDEINCSRESQ